MSFANEKMKLRNYETGNYYNQVQFLSFLISDSVCYSILFFTLFFPFSIRINSSSSAASRR